VRSHLSEETGSADLTAEGAPKSVISASRIKWGKKERGRGREGEILLPSLHGLSSPVSARALTRTPIPMVVAVVVVVTQAVNSSLITSSLARSAELG